MANVFDAAVYILERIGESSAMKLQKLVYYSQAWSLVWEENELFNEDFEAWANGPVVRDLYSAHRGLFKVDTATFKGRGSSSNLSDEQRDTIDKVLEFYGDKTAQWLSNLTHRENPWQEARGDLEPMASCTTPITKASMAEYYSAL